MVWTPPVGTRIRLIGADAGEYWLTMAWQLIDASPNDNALIGECLLNFIERPSFWQQHDELVIARNVHMSGRTVAQTGTCEWNYHGLRDTGSLFKHVRKLSQLN